MGMESIKKIIKDIEEKKKVKYLGEYYYNYKQEDFNYNDGVLDKDGNYIKIQKSKKKDIYVNWFKKLVKQKINYSIAKPPIVDKKLPIQFNIEDLLMETVLRASLDSRAWIHLYLNQNNELDWGIVKDSSIIQYKDDFNKYITLIVRFWVEKDDDNGDEKTFVQVWDTKEVKEFYYKDENIIGEISSKSHYLEKFIYQDKEEKINPKGFGFIPFIPLENNQDNDSDLEPVKIVLDLYNSIATGFIQNVYEFQEAILKLKAFNPSGLESFMEQLKKYKAIPIPADGDIDKLTIDIPVEARKVLLDILKDLIFFLGDGVDPKGLQGSGNITNVVIQSMYSDLDMKCSNMEKMIRKFYRQLIYYINMYYALNLDDEIVFNRSKIFNVSESIENIIKLSSGLMSGIISKETLIKNNPLIDNYVDEIKQIKKEQEEESNYIELDDKEE
jgi:SPP1 family phage portal protein